MSSDKLTEGENPYRQSIFTQPGRTGLFACTFFYGLNRRFAAWWGESDGRSLRRSALVAAGLGALCLALIGGTPADFYRVYTDSGYNQPSIIYGIGEDGEAMAISELLRKSRRVIELEKGDGPRGMHSKIVRCFIATEDNKFLSHPGIDFEGILRAALVNLLAGSVREGASTITQQVARLRFLTNERNIVRKLREAFLSLLIEMRYSKREIMEIYLNMVYLGHGAHGVEAAAQFYFEKSFHELEWGEAAVISSLTTRPESLSPFKNPSESRRKVRVTFQKLVENGDLTVDQAEKEFRKLERDFYAVLDRSPHDNAFHQRLNLHPYATAYVLRQIDELTERGELPSAIRRELYNGGYRIYTTINHIHQSAAEETLPPYLLEQTARRRRAPFRFFDAFDEEYSELQRMSFLMFEQPDFAIKISREERKFLRAFEEDLVPELSLLGYLAGAANTPIALEHHSAEGFRVIEESQAVEGALITLRPDTGAITAVIGGSGFKSSNQQLRFVQASRQPGSAFKPLVYASAIDSTADQPAGERTLTAATLVDDSPVTFVSADLSEYSPENYSRSYEGLIRLRRGLALSKNAVAVRVYERVGPDLINPTVEKLLRMKAGSLPREAAVALGSHAVSPFEMARAYATFASGGYAVDPYVITHITDTDGNILYDARPQHGPDVERRRILKAGTAEIVTSLLRDVVEQGTGKAARLGGWPVAGKTGTTNRSSNAWFVGYTPRLVTALYIGHDRPMSLGAGATGGGLAAPVWGRYMQKAHRGEEGTRFEFPGANLVRVEICENTGMLPGPGCSGRRVELFHPGTQPKDAGENLEELFGPGVSGQEEVIKRPGDIFSEDDL